MHRLKHPRRGRLAALLLALAPGAFATDAAAIAHQGVPGKVPACQACHGADGGGQAMAGFPRLAGLDAQYLRKQLDDLAGGSRDNAVMKPIASGLTEAEREAIAAYYSQLPVPAALATPATPMPAANSVGAVLATRGRWSRQIPGCVQCHGPEGVGVGAHFPPLAGQSSAYIAAQLKAWKRGTRHNDPLQLMQHIGKALDDQDIAAVAAWFAAQPLKAKGATP